MAENSLFAVLLRSPWWISFAIAAAIVTACSALLPRDIVPFASLGAIPMVIVGCMAAWRQLRAPSASKVQALKDAAAAMSWRDFADALERSWQADGQSVKRLNLPAADLQLDKGGQTLLVNAKRWKAANHGVEPLRDLQALVAQREARAGVYVTLQGTISDNARSYAKEHGITLIDGDALAALLAKDNSKK